MYRKLALGVCLVLLTAVAAQAQDKGKDPSKAKELSGMSVIGNEEAPKSLYIVPWKSSELGAATSLNMMWSEDDAPVDRDVFMRQLEFYEVSTAKSAGGSAPK